MSTMSMAAVALEHGINANLLRRWVLAAQMKPVTDIVRTSAVPVAEAPPAKTVFIPAASSCSAARQPSR